MTARLFALVLAALVASLPLAVGDHSAAADPSCPPSEMSLAGSAPFTTTAAVFDSSGAIDSHGDFHVAYDLPAGTAFMHEFHGYGAHPTTYVRASDAFDVVGVPPGTRVDLTVECTVTGAVYTPGCAGAGCWGILEDRLSSASYADERRHVIGLFGGRREFTDVLQIPLSIVAGSPERIHVTLIGYNGPGGNHGVEGTSQPRFLPADPAVTVVSCQGYASAPVPVRPTSWGRLKVSYR